MMEINKEIISAFIDGEILDENLRKDVLSKIESDRDFAIEFKIHSLVKNICREKIAFKRTPEKVKAKILKSIRPKQKIFSANSNFISDLFEKPAFSFATAFVVVLSIILIVFNRPGAIEQKDFAVEQLGSNNMFVQAGNNFQSIIEGKLAPQLTSKNPEEIKEFFSTSGVNYETQVPSFAEWNLLGAVVSEDKGEKFAHHVYTGKSGEIIYLFQVDEAYLYKHDIITLSDDLIEYLDDGNCYTNVSKGKSSLFTKVDNNIWAVVSNANVKDLENTFCNIN